MGAEAAREAMRASLAQLETRQVRRIEQRVVAGDPARALLDIGASPASLIVVGNRGLGAGEGELLGSVPAEVVRNATCDVLVVQTSALDESKLAAEAERARRS